MSIAPKNLHSLTPSTFVPFVRSSNLCIVWFHPENVSTVNKPTYLLLWQSFLAPATNHAQIPVAEFPISNDSGAVMRTLAVNDAQVDTFHIYFHQRRIIYYGLRTPVALVALVRKLQFPKFTVIEGKADEKLFDLVNKVRVLAFVVPGSEFARLYENASLAFGPRIKFFVILDAAIAKSFSPTLKEGIVQVYQPGETCYVELSNPASALDIILFVGVESGKSVLKIDSEFESLVLMTDSKRILYERRTESMQILSFENPCS